MNSLLMKPQEELPSSVTELEDYYNIEYHASSQEINTQHMEDWSILEHRIYITLHQKSTENEKSSSFRRTGQINQ